MTAMMVLGPKVVSSKCVSVVSEGCCKMVKKERMVESGRYG